MTLASVAPPPPTATRGGSLLIGSRATLAERAALGRAGPVSNTTYTSMATGELEAGFVQRFFSVRLWATAGFTDFVTAAGPGDLEQPLGTPMTGAMLWGFRYGEPNTMFFMRAELGWGLRSTNLLIRRTCATCDPVSSTTAMTDLSMVLLGTLAAGLRLAPELSLQIGGSVGNTPVLAQPNGAVGSPAPSIRTMFAGSAFLSAEVMPHPNLAIVGTLEVPMNDRGALGFVTGLAVRGVMPVETNWHGR